MRRTGKLLPENPARFERRYEKVFADLTVMKLVLVITANDMSLAFITTIFSMSQILKINLSTAKGLPDTDTSFSRVSPTGTRTKFGSKLFMNSLMISLL